MRGLVNIRFFEGGQAHEAFIKSGIKIRTKVLKHLSRDEARIVAEALGGSFLPAPPMEDESIDWVVVFEPLKNFKIYYLMRRNEPEFEDEIQVLYNVEGFQIEITAEDVSNFTLLYANAMIYAVRKVLGRRDIPGVSTYL